MRSKQLTTTAVLAILGLVGMISFAGCVSMEDDSQMQAAPQDAMVRSVTAYPTGSKASSALLLEKATPREVAVNAPYSYTIKVTNIANSDLTNVTVVDTMAPDFTLDSAEPKPAVKGKELTWKMGALAKGESQTLTVTGKVSKAGMSTCCTTATYGLETCVTNTVTNPALALEKTAPTDVVICDPIEVVMVVTNAGTGMAKNAVINEKLPDGLVTAKDGRDTVSVVVGDLKPGESKRVPVALKATKAGKFVSTSTATADGNLKATAQTTTTVTEPKLTVTQTGAKTIFDAHKLEYVIKVVNNGNGVAKNTVVTDQMPPQCTFVSADNGGQAMEGGMVQWKLGDLAPKASKELKLTVLPNGIGTRTNKVMAKAHCVDAVVASLDTAVEGIPAILLEVVDLQDPVAVGDQLTYQITVTNQGSAKDTNIKIVCTLEKAMDFVKVGAGSPTAGTASESGRVVTFAPLASLAAKQKAIWLVTVKAMEDGDVRFTVTMDSDNLSRPVSENEATRLYK